jgi:hypothetical protein
MEVVLVTLVVAAIVQMIAWGILELYRWWQQR